MNSTGSRTIEKLYLADAKDGILWSHSTGYRLKQYRQSDAEPESRKAPCSRPCWIDFHPVQERFYIGNGRSAVVADHSGEVLASIRVPDLEKHQRLSELSIGPLGKTLVGRVRDLMFVIELNR